MNEFDETGTMHRRIGGPLLIGIILLPIVFYWFLLRQGYSTPARVGAGVYLALGIALSVWRGIGA